MRLPSPLIVLYYFRAFDNNVKRFGYFLLETAVKVFTTMFFACFIQASKYGTIDLFQPALRRASSGNGHARAIEWVIALLPCVVRASTLIHVLIRNTIDCAENSGALS